MNTIAKYLISLLFIIAVPASADGPARWVVKDSDTNIYLYGTIHVLKPDLHWQTPGMIADFNKSSRIIFELAPDQLTPQVMQPLVASSGMFAGGDNLSNHLDADSLAALNELLAGAGIPPQAIMNMKPWLAAMMLAQVAYAQEGFTGDIGVEKTLTARAEKNGQMTGGLESAAEQISYFSTMPMDEQVNFLKIGIEDFHKASEQINEMLDAWIKGDVDRLASVLNEGMADVPGIYEKLIVQRNKNWIRQIGIFMDTPGTFFMAVGAGHMPGDEGVINLLKEAGYDVRRVE